MSNKNTKIHVCKVCKGKNPECTACDGTGVALMDEESLDAKLFSESNNVDFDNDLLEEE